MAAAPIVFFLVMLVVFNLLPAILVVTSGRVRGEERGLWTIAVLFTSWIGFVAFMVVTTMEAPRRRAAARELEARRKAIPVLDISDHRG